MGKTERQAYLVAIHCRYHKADRRGKSKVLDEFCATCGYNRNYPLRRLNAAEKPPSTKEPGRTSKYNCSEVMRVLRTLWLATDQLVSKRLVSAIPLWLPHYEHRFGGLDSLTKDKLLEMSAATIDRLLLPFRAQEGRKGLCSTKPGSLL